MKKFFSFVAAALFAGTMMAATTMTCADARTAALSVSANNELYNNGEQIEVTGFVTNIAYAWKDSTMTFWMADSLDGGNVLEAYKCAVADSADAPKVTDKVKVTGQLTKYNTTPEFAEGCTCVIIERGEGVPEVEIEVTDCASAAQAALSVSANNELYKNGQVFTVEGYVTSIATPFSATNKNITFWMADTEDGGNVLEAYRAACDSAAAAPSVGDKVSVSGKLTKYNTTPEFAAGCTFEILVKSGDPVNLGPKTIAEFKAMKNKKDTCLLTGVIANLPADESTNAWLYGNFDLVDATDTLYIYGLLTPEGESKQFKTLGLKNGDEITVKAIYNEYNGNPQASNAIYCLPEEDADVVFTSTEFNGQGTSGTGSEVTATKDGVTFHCNKAYGDQYGVRCYKDGVVTISSTDQQIGKIVFEFATVSGKYYNGDLDEEIIVNANEWTNTMTNQARMNKIKIYFGEYEQQEVDTLTVEEAIEIGMALEAGATTEETYLVKGFACTTYAPNEGYTDQTWYMHDTDATAFSNFQAYRCTPDRLVVQGDLMVVKGKIMKYVKDDKVTIEISKGTATHLYGEGIENVVLTEKAQKVVVDGVIYIIRDNKLFNLQGAQVR